MSKETEKKKFKINEDVKNFALADLKAYKKKQKKHGVYFDSKDDLKEQFEDYLLELFPYAIEFSVKYGHIQDEDVQDTKFKIYSRINDPKFIKLIKKELKKDNKIENIKLFPIIGKEILEEAKKLNDEILASNPNGELYDVSDVTELSQLILKKKISNLEKAGISTAIAFDILSIIPNKKAIEYSQFYRIKSFYDCLYEHAKTSEIKFAKIMEEIIPEEFYTAFISFALLERKEKFTKLNDNQKALYLAISNWCFELMDKKLSNKCLEGVIKVYINSRKNDESHGKDSNRRYSLTSLSETDYPRISKVVNNIINRDESVKKYLS